MNGSSDIVSFLIVFLRRGRRWRRGGEQQHHPLRSMCISVSRGTVCRDVTCRARTNCRKPVISLHPKLFLVHREDLDTYLCQRCRDITCLCDATCTHTRTDRHQRGLVTFTVVRDIAQELSFCLSGTRMLGIRNKLVFEPVNMAACWRNNLFCA